MTPRLLLPFYLAAQAILHGATVPSEHRYGSLPDTGTHFTMRHYRSLAEWEARRAILRQQILTAAGLDPMPPRGSLNPRSYGRVERDTFTVERIRIETFPGFFLAGNLYLPKQVERNHPGVLIAHGHWKHGRLEDLPTYSVPALGANLAAQGYVAFAFDMVGYNDTRQMPHVFGRSREEQLWSVGPLGLQLWNSIRALDYLQSLPYVDGKRLAITGASGGGTQTFLLAAVDDRIRVSAPVNMVSAVMQGDDACEIAPGLRVATYNVEFAAMAAPRPLLLISTSKDWTRNTPRQEYPDVRRIYQLYGQPENVQNVHGHSEHNFDRASREAVYTFFRRHLLGIADGVRVPEYVTHNLDPEHLRLPEAGSPPSFADLLGAWKDTVQNQVAEAPPAEKRAWFSRLLGARLPSRISYSQDGKTVILSRSETDDRLRAQFQQGKSGEVLMAIHPQGIEAARRLPAVREAQSRGVSTLLLEVFGTRFTERRRYSGGRDFLTFNRSLDALRVQDILTALAFARYHARQPVRILAYGEAAPWAVLAAAIVPGSTDIRLEMAGVNEEIAERVPFIPGLLRAGGLGTAVALAEQRTGQRFAMFHAGGQVAAARPSGAMYPVDSHVLFKLRP